MTDESQPAIGVGYNGSIGRENIVVGNLAEENYDSSVLVSSDVFLFLKNAVLGKRVGFLACDDDVIDKADVDQSESLLYASSDCLVIL